VEAGVPPPSGRASAPKVVAQTIASRMVVITAVLLKPTVSIMENLGRGRKWESEVRSQNEKLKPFSLLSPDLLSPAFFVLAEAVWLVFKGWGNYPAKTNRAALT
jgi:hypothetical protein